MPPRFLAQKTFVILEKRWPNKKLEHAPPVFLAQKTFVILKKRWPNKKLFLARRLVPLQACLPRSCKLKLFSFGQPLSHPHFGLLEREPRPTQPLLHLLPLLLALPAPIDELLEEALARTEHTVLIGRRVPLVAKQTLLLIAWTVRTRFRSEGGVWRSSGSCRCSS